MPSLVGDLPLDEPPPTRWRRTTVEGSWGVDGSRARQFSHAPPRYEPLCHLGGRPTPGSDFPGGCRPRAVPQCRDGHRTHPAARSGSRHRVSSVQSRRERREVVIPASLSASLGRSHLRSGRRSLRTGSPWFGKTRRVSSLASPTVSSISARPTPLKPCVPRARISTPLPRSPTSLHRPVQSRDGERPPTPLAERQRGVEGRQAVRCSAGGDATGGDECGQRGAPVGGRRGRGVEQDPITDAAG